MHDRHVLDVLEECRAQPHAAVLARDAEEEDLGLARPAAPPRTATTACDWRLGGGWRPGLVLLVRVCLNRSGLGLGIGLGAGLGLGLANPN